MLFTFWEIFDYPEVVSYILCLFLEPLRFYFLKFSFISSIMSTSTGTRDLTVLPSLWPLCYAPKWPLVCSLLMCPFIMCRFLTPMQGWSIWAFRAQVKSERLRNNRWPKDGKINISLRADGPNATFRTHLPMDDILIWPRPQPSLPKPHQMFNS